MYLIVETVTEQEYDPPYDRGDVGSWSPVKREKTHIFTQEAEIVAWIEKNPNASYKAYSVKPLNVSRKVSISLLE